MTQDPALLQRSRRDPANGLLPASGTGQVNPLPAASPHAEVGVAVDKAGRDDRIGEVETGDSGGDFPFKLGRRTNRADPAILPPYRVP
jgi:hypothetical protein